MLASASSEKRDTRTRRRSCIRGWVIPQWRAASVCVQRFFLAMAAICLHELGACSQIRGLLWCIGECIPHACIDLGFGRLRSFINSLSRPFASSISRFEVRCVFFSNACRTITASGVGRCRSRDRCQILPVSESLGRPCQLWASA